MSYKIHTNDNTILHSDIYMGTDFSEGFKHWKYIKRYKGKNGKWQYVYADKNTHKAIKILQKQSSGDILSKDAWKRQYNMYNTAANSDVYKYTGNPVSSTSLAKAMNRKKQLDKRDRAKRHYAENINRAIDLDLKANKLIDDNSIGKKTKNKVGDTTKKAKRAINKGKSKIKALLGK
nr:MAG TPA: hypothetical protein [Caudoviricetes sp.]